MNFFICVEDCLWQNKRPISHKSFEKNSKEWLFPYLIGNTRRIFTKVSNKVRKPTIPAGFQHCLKEIINTIRLNNQRYRSKKK